MEEDLIHLLLNDAGVKNEISDRVHWAKRPQASALPSITVQRISDIPSADECGAHDLTETRVQVDCWGKTGFEAMKVGRAVEGALSGRAFTYRNTNFVGCYIDGGRDSVEPGPTSGSVIHRTRIDVQILHKEI